MQPPDIANLIARIALRERAAFDALYEATSPKLFGILLRLLKDKAAAEDALQEVYLKVWQRADRYAVSEATAMSWLITVTRNHAIDVLRSRKPAARDIDDEADTLEDGAPTPEASALARSQRAEIDFCLDQLENEKADIVRLAYLEGYSYQELADRSNVPLNTMRTWLRRSLIKLKECLTGQVD